MNTEELKSLKVVVLCGGWSDEREVSITSGTECKKALEGYGFQKVDLLDIAEPAFAEKLARGG